MASTPKEEEAEVATMLAAPTRSTRRQAPAPNQSTRTATDIVAASTDMMTAQPPAASRVRNLALAATTRSMPEAAEEALAATAPTASVEGTRAFKAAVIRTNRVHIKTRTPSISTGNSTARNVAEEEGPAQKVQDTGSLSSQDRATKDKDKGRVKAKARVVRARIISNQMARVEPMSNSNAKRN